MRRRRPGRRRGSAAW
uniref:Uncharacterized protein n=1 Tax=Arundo donax TaxID=35708 RepID=A0A0A9F5Z8_ARUDO